MNRWNRPLLAGIATALLLSSAPARADLTANLYPLDTYQIQASGIISFGTIVQAHTNLNAIWASANFRIECSDPAIRPALTGSRGWSDNGFTGPRSIYVTVPEWVPAQQELPGWQNVMGGTYVSCVNTHTAYAKTHILPIGSGGTSFPIGGDGWEASRSQSFGVIKPGTQFGGGCIM
jgi:hypothetical protein